MRKADVEVFPGGGAYFELARKSDVESVERQIVQRRRQPGKTGETGEIGVRQVV